MHVSRLLNRTLEQLRMSLEETSEPLRLSDSSLGWRSGPVRRTVREGLDARGVQHPGQHHHGHDRQADGGPGPVPAAQVPREPQPDQLGQHDGAARPRLPAVHRPRHSSSPAPYTRKKPARTTPPEDRLAASRTASTSISTPSIATREAATTRGAGVSVDWALTAPA